MIRTGITVKLFVIITVFFVAFTSATMIMQSMFFEKFYLDTKTKEFEKNFNNLKLSATELAFDTKELPEFLLNFEDKNNAQVAIVTLVNPTIITRMANIKSPGVKNYAVVPGLTKNAYKLPVPYKEVLSLKGDISLISTVKSIFADQNLVAKAASEQKTLVFKSLSSENNMTNITGIMPIVQDGKTISLIVAVSSLQPIGEATSVIKEFYKYFFALAIILIMVLAFIFSKMVTKPLVTLNKAALKLADLDFSVKCNVNTKDEIGNLAKTFNFLSEKLKDTLTELRNANEKLKEDIEREKSLEIMRKEFIAGVSHELRTPISLIGGYAEGLKDDIPEGKERDFYLDVIVDETRKMEHLVSDMLDLSQLESGNFKLRMEEFCIDQLLTSVLKKFSNSVHSKQIVINTKMPSDNIMVSGDRFRIEQVVINLLNNAIRHTDFRGKITVGLERLGKHALVEIENEGEQIPEKELVNIWQKFYRIEKSRNKELGGTGIGLSIVSNILQLHGSDFGVKNTSTGVKFYFHLAMKKS